MFVLSITKDDVLIFSIINYNGTYTNATLGLDTGDLLISLFDKDIHKYNPTWIIPEM